VYGAGDNAVDGGLSERVELSVPATHEVRFQDVAAASVVLERPEVQLHRQICSPAASRSAARVAATGATEQAEQRLGPNFWGAGAVQCAKLQAFAFTILNNSGDYTPVPGLSDLLLRACET